MNIAELAEVLGSSYIRLLKIKYGLSIQDMHQLLRRKSVLGNRWKRLEERLRTALTNNPQGL